MSLLINRRSAPPGDWRVIVPETGVEIRGAEFIGLLNNCLRHLEINGYSRPSNGEEWLTALLCERMPPGYCQELDPELVGPLAPRVMARGARDEGRKPSAATPSIADVKAGFDTFMRWSRAGRPITTEGEANRRGAICAQCPRNVEARKCPTCNAMYKAVRALTVKRQTKYYAKLNVCGVCKCCNKTQTQIPISLLRRKPGALYPPHCWKLDAALEN